MGKSKPPPNSEDKPTSASLKDTKKLPRRQTMEVQAAWLEPEASPRASRLPDGTLTEKQASPPSSRRGPPNLPGVPHIPPMPVGSAAAPKPRHTIEVDMQWVELVDEAEKAKKDKRDSKDSKKASAEAEATVRRRPIIPREDE